MVKVEQTKLDGVLLVTPETFRDHRGIYKETYNINTYTIAGIPQLFVQDDISMSRRNVLRGIHGDRATWKLVSCLFGSISLVVVNWDMESGEYGQWQLFNLLGEHYQQVLIPPKFGNGHLVLSDQAMFHYKQTTYYNQYPQFTIPYNDPGLGIDWPIMLGKQPITSERDRAV